MCEKLVIASIALCLWFGICWIWVGYGFGSYRFKDRVIFTFLLMVVLPVEVVWGEICTNIADMGNGENNGDESDGRDRDV